MRNDLKDEYTQRAVENSYFLPKPSGRQDAQRERNMKVSAAPKEEDITGEVVAMGVDMVEVEEMVNALTKTESHATSINPGSSVSIVMNMVTLKKSVPSQTEERGPILLQHKPMMNRHC